MEDFEVHYDYPDDIKITEEILDEPKKAKLIKEVGIDKILDNLEIIQENNFLYTYWYDGFMENLICEQREIICNHLGHILANFFNVDVIYQSEIKELLKKDLEKLAELEIEPGEFE